MIDYRIYVLKNTKDIENGTVRAKNLNNLRRSLLRYFGSDVKDPESFAIFISPGNNTTYMMTFDEERQKVVWQYKNKNNIVIEKDVSKSGLLTGKPRMLYRIRI